MFTCDLVKASELSPAERIQRQLHSTIRVNESHSAYGTGFIIDKDNGYAVTNWHVLDRGSKGEEEDSKTYTIQFYDPTHARNVTRPYDATLVGKDEARDIAVLQFEPTENTVCAHFSDAQVMHGDPVSAVGNPLYQNFFYTAGIVTNPNYTINNQISINHTALINRGNSGGALWSEDAEVIAVNDTTIGVRNFSGQHYSIGYAASIPAGTAISSIKSIIEHGYVDRGYTGIKFVDLTAKQRAEKDLYSGIRVSKVEEASPAEVGGIIKDDIILQVNGEWIDHPRDLNEMFLNAASGTGFEVNLLRDGVGMTLSFTTTTEEEYLASLELKQREAERLSSLASQQQTHHPN